MSKLLIFLKFVIQIGTASVAQTGCLFFGAGVGVEVGGWGRVGGVGGDVGEGGEGERVCAMQVGQRGLVTYIFLWSRLIILL